MICVDNLPYGDYSVKEESAPTGYKVNDANTYNVTMDNNAKCNDNSSA